MQFLYYNQHISLMLGTDVACYSFLKKHSGNPCTAWSLNQSITWRIIWHCFIVFVTYIFVALFK